MSTTTPADEKVGAAFGNEAEKPPAPPEPPVPTTNGARSLPEVKAPSPYLIFRKTEQGTWVELTNEQDVIKAEDPVEARALAVEKFGLQDALTGPSGLTLVAVSPRYWKPKSAGVKVSTSVEWS